MQEPLALIWLAHLTGDFLFQNSWMALGKRQNWLSAIVHGIFYGIAFVIVGLVFGKPGFYDPVALAIIAGTHVLIDRYAIAAWWVRLYNWDWNDGLQTPLWVCVAVDQALHLWFNTLAIEFLV